ncbi:MAG: ComF family protein [Saprospiraceae bacterium]
MYKQVENEFTRRMWGLFPLRTGAAMFYLRKGSPIQKAIHGIKYRNQAKIGLLFGKQFGAMLRNSAHYGAVDCIVPLPLHPERERKRGYNQSLYFARGIAASLGKACVSSAVTRVVKTDSQTRKNRMERFDNVCKVFRLTRPQLLEGKHVLLIDDVLTTGATLESCGHALLKGAGVQVSMATLAMAVNR